MSVEPPRSLRVSVTQHHAGLDVQANLAAVLGLIEEASAAPTDLIVIAENGLCLGTNDQMRASALRLDGTEIGALRAAARRAGAPVCLGGFKRLVAGDDLVRNTALLIDARGEIAALYDKIHLFDSRVQGQVHQASRVERAGEQPLIASINGVPIGLTICYDVRFPELYRRLARDGAMVFLVPAAFLRATGPAHWEVLLRARAIENGAFVVASATSWEPGDTYASWGHALVVDPWGTVVTDLGDAPRAWRTVELDLAAVAKARTQLPVLNQVRDDAYDTAAQIVAVG